MAESESEQSMSHMPDLSHHLHLPTTRTSLFLDRLLDRIGSWASWLWLAVMAVILLSVIMRYAFGQGSIMLEEITWHIYGAAWLVGLSYALVHDDHVRVDVLHEMFSPRTKAWVEFFGILLLLLPFLVVDLLVANTLTTVGFAGLPPPLVALPFKLLLFVAVDGWALFARGFIAGYSG